MRYESASELEKVSETHRLGLTCGMKCVMVSRVSRVREPSLIFQSGENSPSTTPGEKSWRRRGDDVITLHSCGYACKPKNAD